MNWKVVAIAGWIVILVAAAFAAGLIVSGKLGRPSVSPATPTPASAVASTSVPTLSSQPATNPSPSPSPPPPPAKPHFVVVSTDWQDCQQIPHCYAHGIFQNNGNGAGSVAVTFTMPPESGFSASCQTTVPVVPAGSVGEARCDLGDDAKLYLDENSPNTLKPPVASVSNP
jgi:hypothetical protein